jgi:hypothetical protein
MGEKESRQQIVNNCDNISVDSIYTRIYIYDESIMMTVQVHGCIYVMALEGKEDVLGRQQKYRLQ